MFTPNKYQRVSSLSSNYMFATRRRKTVYEYQIVCLTWGTGARCEVLSAWLSLTFRMGFDYLGGEDGGSKSLRNVGNLTIGHSTAFRKI